MSFPAFLNRMISVLRKGYNTTTTNLWHAFECLKITLSEDVLNVTWCVLALIGPSEVRALPLAAGLNVGGHYFRYFIPLVGVVVVVVVLLPPLLKSQKGLS